MEQTGTIIEGDIKEAYERGEFDLNDIKFPFVWKHRVIFKAGVYTHPQSGKPLRYPADELERTVDRVNDKPIILPESLHIKAPGKTVGFVRNGSWNAKDEMVMGNLELLDETIIRILARGAKLGLSPAYAYFRASGGYPDDFDYTYDPDYDEISLTFNPNLKETMLNTKQEKMNDDKITALEKQVTELTKQLTAMQKEKEDKVKEDDATAAEKLKTLEAEAAKDKAELKKAQDALKVIEDKKIEKEITEMVDMEIESGRVPKEHREGRITEARSMTPGERKGIVTEIKRTDEILRGKTEENPPLPEKQLGRSEDAAEPNKTIEEQMLDQAGEVYNKIHN